MDLDKDWKLIKKVFQQATDSSGYHALASVNTDGSPHITPTGSLGRGKMTKE
jgi:predicted pyridoxine 5'-phosphate oxidase superfamily flavin-nucleotide-binding protein